MRGFDAAEEVFNLALERLEAAALLFKRSSKRGCHIIHVIAVGYLKLLKVFKDLALLVFVLAFNRVV